MEPILMPKLALTMEEAKVISWRKREGEPISRGEPLVEIETEKATTEMESPCSGYLRKIVVREGETAPVDAVLAYVALSREELVEEVTLPIEGKTQGEIVPDSASATFSPSDFPPGASEKIEEGETIRAAPAARKLARELGLDLRTVKGTGPQGRITPEDVKRAKADPKPWASDFLAKRRNIIAALNKSLRSIPHINLCREIPVDEMVAFKRTVPHLTYTELLLRAFALVAEDFPILKLALVEDQLHESQTANVGVVTDTGDGLVIPVIKEANRKGLHQLARELRELTQKARQGQLTHRELEGATVSLSNLGMHDIDLFTAIVPYGQIGILTVGRIRKWANPGDGPSQGRYSLWVNLAADHRLLDGVTGAKILSGLATRLGNEATWADGPVG